MSQWQACSFTASCPCNILKIFQHANYTKLLRGALCCSFRREERDSEKLKWLLGCLALQVRILIQSFWLVSLYHTCLGLSTGSVCCHVPLDPLLMTSWCPSTHFLTEPIARREWESPEGRSRYTESWLIACHRLDTKSWTWFASLKIYWVGSIL